MWDNPKVESRRVACAAFWGKSAKKGIMVGEGLERGREHINMDREVVVGNWWTYRGLWDHGKGTVKELHISRICLKC